MPSRPEKIWKKRCAKCKDVLPLTSFRNDPRTKDGLRRQCINCQREESHQSYLRNKDLVAERKREREAGRPPKPREPKSLQAMPQTTAAKSIGLYPCAYCPGFFRLGDMETHLKLHGRLRAVER